MTVRDDARPWCAACDTFATFGEVEFTYHRGVDGVFSVPNSTAYEGIRLTARPIQYVDHIEDQAWEVAFEMHFAGEFASLTAAGLREFAAWLIDRAEEVETLNQAAPQTACG